MRDDGILTAIGVGTLVLVMLFVFPLLHTAMGAFVGWVISLTPLGGWIINGFSYFGVKIDNLVNLGAMLGFISGFFKSVTTNNKN